LGFLAEVVALLYDIWLGFLAGWLAFLVSRAFLLAGMLYLLIGWLAALVACLARWLAECAGWLNGMLPRWLAHWFAGSLDFFQACLLVLLDLLAVCLPGLLDWVAVCAGLLGPELAGLPGFARLAALFVCC
jgi:hypothetical protein